MAGTCPEGRPRAIHGRVPAMRLQPQAALAIAADVAGGDAGGARGGDGEEEPLRVVERPGVDADHPAVRIEQRAAAVAVVDGGRVADVEGSIWLVRRRSLQA